ncbi:MAG: hypothetical protein LRZ94_01170 [Candidatus Pacebacteria bacterium]|nr:hypothetical protein [Candidatus Paceibacterota bacterium]
MTVLEIVQNHLKRIGCDGLCADECSCVVEDICPCGAALPKDCEPGYKKPSGLITPENPKERKLKIIQQQISDVTDARDMVEEERALKNKKLVANTKFLDSAGSINLSSEIKAIKIKLDEENEKLRRGIKKLGAEAKALDDECQALRAKLGEENRKLGRLAVQRGVCPFPESCNSRHTCTDTRCNADVCSNGYAYRFS